MISFSSHLFYSTHENSKLRLVGLRLSQFLSYILCILQKSFSFIISLNLPSSPTTVMTAIVAIWVYSVNRGITYSKFLAMYFIRFFHINLEAQKIKPIFVDAYSTTSIVFKRFVIWFCTSAKNLSMYIVKSSSVHSVFSSGLLQSFYPRTTTRSSMPISKVVAPYHNQLPTIAYAIKHCSTLFCVTMLNYFQFSKFLSCQVYKFSHISSLSRLLGLVNQDGGDKYYQLIEYKYV